MKRTIPVFILIVLSISVFENSGHAGDMNLLGMSNSKKENMSRVSLVFDRIPKFRVENSGRRVRVLLPRTSFADSFREISGKEVVPPLVQVKTGEDAGESVVELYFRDLPKYVDVAVEGHENRLNVNVFWNPEEAGPEIKARKIGRLEVEGGAASRDAVSSRYSGRWIDFFREFEWSPRFSIPYNFSFPEFPSPAVIGNEKFFPPEIMNAGITGKWGDAAAGLQKLLSRPAQNDQADAHRLFLAECLLHQDKIDEALDVLGQIGDRPEDPFINGWREYFRTCAMALSGQHKAASGLAAGLEEKFPRVKGLAPWLRLLRAEIDLVTGSREQAPQGSGQSAFEGEHSRIHSLRGADALYERGRLDEALPFYLEAARDPAFIRQYPRSLGNCADTLYKMKKYAEAHTCYALLSEAVPGAFREQRELARYWSAMARLRAGARDLARLMFVQGQEKGAATGAGFQSQLKLLDLDLLDSIIDIDLSRYDGIIENGPSREIREEAFFKKILACHLQGQDYRTMKLLGRFLEDYWAGALRSEAQALLLELMPRVIDRLVDEQDFFTALALVAKHRDLLAKAQITYDFLNGLARSYAQAGFLDQAIATYLYVLDFEKDEGKKRGAFLPLIALCYQQMKYDQVGKYASRYLEAYPGGGEKEEILYHYANALFKKGDLRGVIRELHEKSRPPTKELDILAGKLFREMGRYDLAETYLSRATNGNDGGNHPEIILRKAEVLFSKQDLQKAFPLYESLLNTPGFNGQAGYRLIQGYMDIGENRKALNVYNKLAEMNVGKQWLDLAGETVRIGNP